MFLHFSQLVDIGISHWACINKSFLTHIYPHHYSQSDEWVLVVLFVEPIQQETRSRAHNLLLQTSPNQYCESLCKIFRYNVKEVSDKLYHSIPQWYYYNSYLSLSFLLYLVNCNGVLMALRFMGTFFPNIFVVFITVIQ